MVQTEVKMEVAKVMAQIAKELRALADSVETFGRLIADGVADETEQADVVNQKLKSRLILSSNS